MNTLESSAGGLAHRLQQAAALHARGRLVEAMAIYTHIIELDAAQPDALHLLGVALTQCEQPERGAALIEKSLAVNPAQPVACANLGNCLLALERLGAALASFDRSIAMWSGYAPAHSGRGSALAALERHQEALESFDRALELMPNFLEALNNRGVALLKLKRFDSAVEAFDTVLAARPHDAKALASRAAALQEQSRHAEALADCDRAIGFLPSLFDAQYVRCNALLGLRRFQEALAQIDRLLGLHPDHAQAMLLRSRALQELGRNREAIAGYERVLELAPRNPEALLFIGTLEMSERHYERAAEAFEQLEEIEPDRDFVSGALLHAQLHLFEWSAYAAGVEKILAGFDAGAAPDQPFSFLAISDSAERQLECARRLQQKSPRAAAPFAPFAPAVCARRERIRVVYVSADFLEHPMAFLLAGLFEAHDRGRFEIMAISLREDVLSPTGRRLKGAFDRFIDVSGQSDAEIAGVIRGLDADIAVDLMGYTAKDRPGVLRDRPAPLQVNYLGFPATMGAAHIDYILADRFVIPRESAPFFSEAIAYLPDCFQGNDGSRTPAPDAVARSAVGLPEQGFVWCSFHTGYKVNPPLFEVWARLLLAVPGSVLWLVSVSSTAETNLRREAARRGVDPGRLVFAKIVQYPRHLARLKLADLCLDTWPFNGGATTSDALWMGVPVITRAGAAFASRMSGSLLETIGLPELVTETFADYEQLAIRLAQNPQELDAVRARLAVGRAKSPLFDTHRFRRSVEAAYSVMWERHLRGERPESFDVPG